MKKRIITGFIILAVLIPAIYLDGVFFLSIGIFLSMVASYEMMNMFYTKSPSLHRFRYFVPILSGFIVLMIYFAVTRGLNQLVHIDTMTSSEVIYRMLFHFWTITVFVASIAICLGALIFTKNSTAHDMMACVMTLTYCGLIMGYVISIEYIEPIAASPYINLMVRGGRSFGYLLTIVIVTDSVAYLVGTKFGKHRLAPDISPKKSVEGAVAGLIAGGIIGVGVAFLYQMVDFAPATSIGTKFVVMGGLFLLSIIISFCVQLGDLIASKLKRSYGIKDFGKIFPGHGGVLDRFDSLIFAGAAFYVIVQFVQLAVLGALR
ncbi:MAG: phosphatidate cytidylyltransferase [Bacilli bacterium]|jgi:phosphatidate cytidylyltransferase|nr:phosphatidate cytidylyltransferase [Bacilli bacterium]MDY0063959.1 phosphatidate cytidylyltransferase [Bacilli bacterium]